jgi:hypothetical protein
MTAVGESDPPDEVQESHLAWCSLPLKRIKHLQAKARPDAMAARYWEAGPKLGPEMPKSKRN